MYLLMGIVIIVIAIGAYIYTSRKPLSSLTPEQSKPAPSPAPEPAPSPVPASKPDSKPSMPNLVPPMPNIPSLPTPKPAPKPVPPQPTPKPVPKPAPKSVPIRPTPNPAPQPMPPRPMPTPAPKPAPQPVPPRPMPTPAPKPAPVCALPPEKKRVPCPQGYAWDTYESKCLKKFSSPFYLKIVPWPSQGDTSDLARMLNNIINCIKITHHAPNVDPRAQWAIYHNSVEFGGDGFLYVLLRTGDIKAKLASYAESWRRATILINNTAKKLPDNRVGNLMKFLSVPNRYGGVVPLVESGWPDYKPRSGAFTYTTTFDNCRMSTIFSLYSMQRPTPGQTISDKRFGIVIHELSHVACLNSKKIACEGLDKTSHGGDQVITDNMLRDIAAAKGLKPRPTG